jgi:GNAT superfamily N-acetyltransferase
MTAPMIRETIIRPARSHDSEAIGQIHVRSWQATYKGILPAAYLAALSPQRVAQSVRMAMMDPRNIYLIARSGRQSVGYITAGPPRIWDPVYQAELYELYLLPEIRSRGLGGQLLADVARRLYNRHLYTLKVWVLSRNPHRRFYEKRGAIYLGSKSIFFAGRTLQAENFGWVDITLAME